MSEAHPSEAGPKAVVFDVGNVLFRWDLRFLFDEVIVDPLRREHFLSEVLTFEFHTRHDAGEPIDALASELRAAHPEYADEIHAYVTRFNETVGGPVAGVHELVERLHARDVPLFALTNFGTDFWQVFQPTAPILDRFRDILVSGEERLAKPDPAIYRRAEERFSHAPGELFFIDDREENVAAARACGWHAHLFVDSDVLTAQLRSLQLLD